MKYIFCKLFQIPLEWCARKLKIYPSLCPTKRPGGPATYSALHTTRCQDEKGVVLIPGSWVLFLVTPLLTSLIVVVELSVIGKLPLTCYEKLAANESWDNLMHGLEDLVHQTRVLFNEQLDFRNIKDKQSVNDENLKLFLCFMFSWSK